MIQLLHLSDLHFGEHSRFHGADAARLGKAFHGALVAARRQVGMGDGKVDLVVVTPAEGVRARTGVLRRPRRGTLRRAWRAYADLTHGGPLHYTCLSDLESDTPLSPWTRPSTDTDLNEAEA